MNKNLNYYKFKSELEKKYGISLVASQGNKAVALMVFEDTLKKIPNELSIEEEENIFYDFINKICKLPTVNEFPNSIQNDFIYNCCLDIINQNPNLFRNSDLSTPEKIKLAISAMGFVGGSLPSDYKIKEDLTILNLREDLFFLYIKKYFLFLRNPDDKIFNTSLMNRPNTETNSPLYYNNTVKTGQSINQKEIKACLDSIKAEKLKQNIIKNMEIDNLIQEALKKIQKTNEEHSSNRANKSFFTGSKGAIFGSDPRVIIETLLDQAKPILTKLKNESSIDYIEQSQKLVLACMDAVLSYTVDIINFDNENKSNFGLSDFPFVWHLVLNLGTFDMKDDFRIDSYELDKNSLKKLFIARGIKISDNIEASQNNINKIEKKQGCYIATMTYGDYHHPQVMILRKYRDNVLLKSFFGKIVISVYYFISPKIVKIFGNSIFFKKITKSILDKFISRINKF